MPLLHNNNNIMGHTAARYIYIQDTLIWLGCFDFIFKIILFSGIESLRLHYRKNSSGRLHIIATYVRPTRNYTRVNTCNFKRKKYAIFRRRLNEIAPSLAPP